MSMGEVSIIGRTKRPWPERVADRCGVTSSQRIFATYRLPLPFWWHFLI